MSNAEQEISNDEEKILWTQVLARLGGFTGVTAFCECKFDDLVKSRPGRHSGENRSPEYSRKTGFPPPRE
jgi:hypothetical protein